MSTTQAEITRLRANLAVLEEVLRGEIREGTLLVVINSDDLEYLEVGDVIAVGRTDFNDPQGLEVSAYSIFDEHAEDWLKLSQVEAISKERAREILITQIDRRLTDLQRAEEFE